MTQLEKIGSQIVIFQFLVISMYCDTCICPANIPVQPPPPPHTHTQMPIEDVQSHTRNLVREMGKMKETLNDLAEIVKQMAIKQGIDTEDTEDVTDEGQEEPSISMI